MSRSPPEDQVAILLDRARNSLDDARLLAERRRRNEAVLCRVALSEALRAISVSEGLDADEDMRLDTLFRRVPADHPQAALVTALRDPARQFIAAVAELVEALSSPPPATGPATGAVDDTANADDVPAPTPARAAFSPRTTPGPAPDRSTRPTDTTALGASPRGETPAGAPGDVPGSAFWALMDRWKVDDLQALALIGHRGGLTKGNTRPRFRLQNEQAARYALLRRLDMALQTLDLDPTRWLHAGGKDAPLRILEQGGRDGAQRLLHALNRQGLKAGLRKR